MVVMRADGQIDLIIGLTLRTIDNVATAPDIAGDSMFDLTLAWTKVNVGRPRGGKGASFVGSCLVLWRIQEA